jgi:hypothetical protein
MKAVPNVKTDAEVNTHAQSLAKHLGIPLSTVVNAYLGEFVASGEFRIAREPEVRPEIAHALHQVCVESRDKKYLSPSFKNAADAVAPDTPTSNPLPYLALLGVLTIRIAGIYVRYPKE